jgi:hypothetical protein
MKRIALAIALACVLSGSALAGDVHSPSAPAPGDMGNGGAVALDGEMGNGIDDGNQGAGGLVLLTILDLVF